MSSHPFPSTIFKNLNPCPRLKHPNPDPQKTLTVVGQRTSSERPRGL